MFIKVDPSSKVPLQDQIAAGIRRAIADGEVAEGEQLPTARELADGLGVNMHTVLKGYSQLRDEQILEFRRGRGVRVIRERRGRARLMQLVHQLATEVRREGLDAAEACSLLQGALG